MLHCYLHKNGQRTALVVEKIVFLFACSKTHGRNKLEFSLPGILSATFSIIKTYTFFLKLLIFEISNG